MLFSGIGEARRNGRKEPRTSPAPAWRLSEIQSSQAAPALAAVAAPADGSALLLLMHLYPLGVMKSAAKCARSPA
jgi:hypothetical protein